MNPELKTVLVTGGAGYVGSALVPALLKDGYHVRVLDLYWYGEDALLSVRGHRHLDEIKGDMRDKNLLENVMEGVDAVIHLAGITNDASFELNPALAKSINYDALNPLIESAKANGVWRFVYTSSASVYGKTGVAAVKEDQKPAPDTDYSMLTQECETLVLNHEWDDFNPVVVRPGVVCGYSPRLRLDLSVNILTNHAVNLGKIRVLGGDQTQPNIHIHDLVDAYRAVLKAPAKKVTRQIFNVASHNGSFHELVEMVRKGVIRRIPKHSIEVTTMPTEENHSYAICSDKIKRELGFSPKRVIEDAVDDLTQAFVQGRVPNAQSDFKYYNIKTMQNHKAT